jgi:hypothetical protein
MEKGQEVLELAQQESTKMREKREREQQQNVLGTVRCIVPPITQTTTFVFCVCV